jgi:hypothetical protein
MRLGDMIEFYDGSACIASTNSSIVPPVGSKISIRKKTWTVIGVTYVLDHADETPGKMMRANVDLEAS